MKFKSGFVTIIGDTNVGKSTLINSLIGEKIAIVSPKPQTSRQNTIGVFNDDNCQIVFIDTPGYHKTKHKLDEFMQDSIDEASDGVDVLVFMIDGKKPLKEQYEKLYKQQGDSSAKKILCINKIDECTFEKMYPQLDELNKICKTDEILPISAKLGKNVDVLISMIKKYLPEYDMEMRYYPVEEFTDKNVRFLAAEIIREKILLHYDDEIPHGVAVQISSFEETDNLCTIYADIFCERDSHKTILIGKHGEKIKELSIKSREAIERLVDKNVYLELFVKVKPNWRVDNLMLEELGYKLDK